MSTATDLTLTNPRGEATDRGEVEVQHTAVGALEVQTAAPPRTTPRAPPDNIRKGLPSSTRALGKAVQVDTRLTPVLKALGFNFLKVTRFQI